MSLSEVLTVLRRPYCSMGMMGAYLMTSFTLIRLFATVYPLVALKVVLLDKPHITDITLKRLLTWARGKKK